MIAPAWMHELVTAEEYESWSDEQRAGIEIVDGMIFLTPSASRAHNRIARLVANALDTAHPDWRADLDFDVRLQDSPLHNRRPDVVVYRADATDEPMRPASVLLVVEVVSPGSESTDRSFKAIEYAQAGIRHYWRIESVKTGRPVVHTYVLDHATRAYRATEVFTGIVKAITPFPVEFDLRGI
jgi:Uma2 family endonuclease